MIPDEYYNTEWALWKVILSDGLESINRIEMNIIAISAAGAALKAENLALNLLNDKYKEVRSVDYVCYINGQQELP